MAKKKKTGLTGQWVQIFASGIHTSSNGTIVTITDEDLETISTLYNKRVENGTDGDRAPAIKGHTNDSSVGAWAWLSETKVEGSKLFGKFDDIVDEFEKEVENKQFYNRSIAVSSDFLIEHIAFLGAVPPAIKGMDDFSSGKSALEFSKGFDDKNKTLEFSREFIDWGIEDRFGRIGRIFRNFKNYLIEKDGVEKANEIISEYDIEDMNVDPREKEDYNIIKTNKFNYSKNKPLEEPMTKEEKEAFDTLKNSVSEFSETVKTLKSNNEKILTEFSALKEENETMKVTKLTAEKDDTKANFNALADNLVEAGKITAAVANSQKENFASVIDAGVLEFSEGDKKITALDKHKANLSVLSGVAVIDFKEFAKKSDATNQFSQNQLDALEGKSIADCLN